MICPHCGSDNLPGSEDCSNCGLDLTQLDRPVAQNRIEHRLMEDTVSVLRPKLPITVQPSTTVRQTIQAMLDHGNEELVGVHGYVKLEGVCIERDLLRH